jgi:hypothetical protein
MAAKNQKESDRMAVDPSLLEWAEYWYPISWKGVLGGGIITAIGACATIAFLLLQWRATTIREEQSDWRTTVVESETAKSKAELGVAQADIAKAKVQIAEANARVAEAERQNLDLRAKVASRRITAEQHKILVDELSKNPGLFDIAVMGDPESSLFAGDILKTLADAGWTVGGRELPLGEIWTGLVLFQTDDPAARRILDALLKAKIPVSIGDAAHKRPKATIMVGNKPSLF